MIWPSVASDWSTDAMAALMRASVEARARSDLMSSKPLVNVCFTVSSMPGRPCDRFSRNVA